VRAPVLRAISPAMPTPPTLRTDPERAVTRGG
jgi:hypothetical protein